MMTFFFQYIDMWLINEENDYLVTFARPQDSADSGGSHQRERCQSEQLSRGADGENHLCQRQQGEANVCVTCRD